ncbi:MAG: DUF4440 domain-containing protein [Alphaproteobacteria bacterium]|nr:DUF4440 domain-containing protein [Alphaproteobacteria bacterium]
MSDEAALAELREINAKFIHNFVTNDAAAHDVLLHEKFFSILPNGMRIARAPYLAAWSRGFDPAVIVYWDYRDEQIEVIRDTAVVSATCRWVRVQNGTEIAGMTIYADTYVREMGMWKCILAQLTNQTPDCFPPDSTIVRKYIHGKLA